MKRFLLTVTAIASTLMASAQWTKPTIEPNDMSEMAVGEVMYLYNTGTRMFLNQGNANGTQASLADEGLKMKVEKRLVEVDGQAAPKDVSWTSSADDFFGDNGVVQLEGLTFTLGDPNDGTTTWSWHEGNGGSLANHMPSTDGTVETLITEFSEVEPFGTLPTHGSFLKLEPTAKGRVTIAGKPSGGQGQSLVLVTADKSDPTKMLAAKVTPIDPSVSEWAYDVEDAYVYYFFQLAQPEQLTSWRFTLRSVAFVPAEAVVEKEYVWDGKTYTLQDFNEVQNKWCYMYLDDKGGCYMNGNKPSDYFWELTQQENGCYRIGCAEANPTQNTAKWPSCYVGMVLTEEGLTTTILNPYVDASELEAGLVYCLDWAFVSEEVYARYTAQREVYLTAVKLGEVMAECAEKGLNTADFQKVYDNTSSTLAELQAALYQAEAMLSAEDEKSVTPDHPKDFTNRIANPNFDEGVTGWLCEYTGPKKNDIPKADPGWAPETVEEVMIAPAVSMWLNNQSSHLWQVVTGIPNGIYELSAGIWSDNNGPVFYANDATVSIPKCGATKYVLLTCVSDNTLEFGLRAPAEGVQWYMADFFRLQYFGNGTEAYRKWIDETLSGTDSYEGVPCYRPLYEDYVSAMEKLTAATQQEDIVGTLPLFLQLYDSLKTNVAAYEAYENLVNEAIAMAEGGAYVGDDFDKLCDYVMMEADPDGDFPNGSASYILNNGNLTTEQIQEETAALEAMMKAAVDNGMTKGASATAKMQNPNFEDGLKGWTYDTKLSKPAAGGLAANPNVECWNANFDFYQVVSLPNGVYQVDAQVFYRTASNGTADGEWTSGEAEVLTELYANTGVTKVKNVYDEAQEAGFYKEDNAYTMQNGLTVPNSMKTASEAFVAGLYENTVVGVVWDGQLRVGIRSLNASANDRWSIWDNFRITFLGMEAEPIADCYDATIREVEDMLDNDDLTEELQADLLAAMSLPVDKADAEGTLAVIAKIREAMDAAHTYVTAIDVVPAQQGEPTVTGIYSMSGTRLSALQKGINVVRYSDGRVKKVLVK